MLEADGQRWPFYEEEPYAGCVGKTGANKRWCTRMGCVRALTRTRTGHRSKLPECVEDIIEKQFGKSQVGFRPRGQNKRKKTDCEQSDGEAAVDS
mmetsp:Transcript_9351/g.28346  ORF Transcript_9351/g.28346 Transcript_9351/m.28346 type:complete len:95 (-) Transcript_9351:214-498(-)